MAERGQSLKVRWTRAAQNDLDQIGRFIANENPAAAVRMQEKLFSAGESLDVFPGRGRPGGLPGTRELVIASTPYRLVYVGDADATVILAVVHGARHWPPAAESR